MHNRRDPTTALGRALCSLRQHAGLSQEELARRAEVEPTLITEVEAGQADPTWGDTRRIAAALGTSVDRIAELVEELEDKG